MLIIIFFATVFSSNNSTSVDKPSYLDLDEYEVADHIKAWYIGALALSLICCFTCYICGDQDETRAQILGSKKYSFFPLSLALFSFLWTLKTT